MTKEELDKEWAVLSSATNIKHQSYDEAVTIGGVFGRMRSTIEQQQKEIEQLEKILSHYQ